MISTHLHLGLPVLSPQTLSPFSWTGVDMADKLEDMESCPYIYLTLVRQ